MGIKPALRALIFTFAIFFLINPIVGQERTLSEEDGTEWLKHPEALRIGLVQGMIMGISLMDRELAHIYKALEASEDAFVQRQGKYLRDRIDNLNLYRITTGQLLNGVDDFYKDFSNRRIAIIDALYVVKMQITGKDPDLIQAQIRYLKIQPVNSEVLLEADIKFNRIYLENLEKSEQGQYGITIEDIKNGRISEEELLRTGRYVDRNNVNHTLFCYGVYK